MNHFSDKLAVITGAGTGMGRALAELLASEGCHLGLCDINLDTLAETAARCQAHGVRVLTARCDVGLEQDIRAFQAAVAAHSDHIDLLVNNAGISGGGSFIHTSRDEWERTFNICWFGVYHTTRAFLPLLLKAPEGHIVNMSSANGLRAVLGGHIPHTAYSTAKFAVRGFTESLIHDFRFNAPHLSASVVFPGTVGTEIVSNSVQVLGQNAPRDWDETDIANAKRRWEIAEAEIPANISDDEVRQRGQQEIEFFREVGLSAETAAQQIIDGVKAGEWRILIGPDCESLDQLVREAPEHAYDEDFVLRWRKATAQIIGSDSD